MIESRLTIIGGGLAGSEAAWQAAQRGVDVTLFEMRPGRMTPAHQTDLLAELVCSNSLGSNLPDRASGLLKAELRQLGSLIIHCADACAVPAGGALAVGREAFARMVTEAIAKHPRIELVRREVSALPEEGMTILATGPLTLPALADDLARRAGEEQLYFYDAMAPIVTLESIDMGRAFRASRYDRGDDDYINCPMTRDEYERIVEALLAAERMPLRSFEQEDQRFFEACLPVEVLAARGRDALAYGPLKPVGLRDPHSGLRPYAVVQLRQDNLAGTLYSLVGFQTNLKWGEQRRVLALIPGLERAEWVRFGQMHRNTYLRAPRLLDATLRWRERPDLYCGGQIVGTEGYVGSTASGLVAGVNAALQLAGREPVVFPETTMVGALLHYISHAAPDGFQPIKPNFGLLPPLAEAVRRRRHRNAAFAERALADLARFYDQMCLAVSAPVSLNEVAP
jgi:methylenetetrahydrofolate--tRNA-(uracil-5-)-methyltransferase